ncbi:MAG: hypothetical protein ACI802_003812, partial [Candidatus Paceibacteria bacterium]
MCKVVRRHDGIGYSVLKICLCVVVDGDLFF